MLTKVPIPGKRGAGIPGSGCRGADNFINQDGTDFNFLGAAGLNLS